MILHGNRVLKFSQFAICQITRYLLTFHFLIKIKQVKMTNTNLPTALVTGVSGIGSGYVKIILEKGGKIFAVDRKQSALDLSLIHI